MTQILRNTPATIQASLYVNGTLTDFDSTPTVAVVDANGDTVTGLSSVSKPSTGVYRATIPAQSDLTTLRATWTGAVSGSSTVLTTRYEVVGNLLFTEAEARAKTISGFQTPLSSDSSYPDSEIARWRGLITDMFEDRTGRSWVRRYCRVQMDGTGGRLLSLHDGEARTADGPLPRPGRGVQIAKIISATVSGAAVSTSNIAIDGGTLIRKDGVWHSPTWGDPLNVIVEYEYGPDPVPYEATENGLRVLLANAVPSDVSQYATSISNEDGTFRIATLPVRVEEWLKSVSNRVMVI